MSDSSSGKERRAHPRVYAALATRVSAGGRTVEAETVNISEGGVLLSGGDLPSGDRVRIEIELAELGWHAIDADVVRREAGQAGDEELAARFAEIATGGGRDAIRAFFEAHLGPGDAPPPAGG